MGRLTGRTAIVTGGAKGIGVHYADALAAEGAQVMIGDIIDGAGVAEDINSRHGQGAVDSGTVDVSSEEAVKKFVAKTLDRFGKIDVLINNAAVFAHLPSQGVEDIDVADWDKVMAVNLRAPFFLAQELLPQLRAAARPEDPARIINIGSIGGAHIPNWEAFPYGASKAGLHHLTRALTKRLGREHIIATAIAPGPFPSRLTDTASDKVKKSVDTYIPLGRSGEAQDIEGLIVFLAAPASRYISGVTIPLDGGYLAAL